MARMCGALMAVLALLGCRDVETQSAAGNLRVHPSALSFGPTGIGHQAEVELHITNEGRAPLRVYSATPSVPDVEVVDFGAFDVLGGASQAIRVRFEPGAEGQVNGVLELVTDVGRDGAGRIQLPLDGLGVPLVVTLDRSQIDFGDVELDAVKTEVLVAHNASIVPAELHLMLDGADPDQFSSSAFKRKLSLAPGETRELSVAFRPTRTGDMGARAWAQVCPTCAPLQVELLGSGVLSCTRPGARPTRTERFEQDPRGKADVLFVIDNSGSMLEEQQSLGQNFSAFLSAAQAANVDYQIAVTTTGILPAALGFVACPGGAMGGENGRLFPPDGSRARIITPSTPDAAAVFAENVRVGLCHADEQGLIAAYQALSEPLLSSTDDPRTALDDDGNAGFLRADARLAIIFVSDEEDFSPNTVAHYEAYFRSLKNGDPTMLSASAIVGPKNLATCPSASSSGLRYIALAHATGGVVESICTPNWAESLKKISRNAFGLKSRFPLTNVPADPSEIVVTVDGVTVTSGWHYDPVDNSIVFDSDAVPEPGAVVVVTFPVSC